MSSSAQPSSSPPQSLPPSGVNTPSTKPSAQCIIRPARLTDAVSIHALYQLVFRNTFAYATAPDDMDAFLGMMKVETVMEEIQNTDRYFFYVAETSPAPLEANTTPAVNGERSGDIAGFIQARLDNTEACVTAGAWPKPFSLDRLYVGAAYQGAGVAHQLIESLLAEGKRRGYQSCWLGVYEDNHRGQRFYSRYGFRKIGSHDFLVGKDCQTDHIYAKEL